MRNLLLLLFWLLPLGGWAQLSLTDGEHTLDLSGLTSTYLRVQTPTGQGTPTLGLHLRDAQVRFAGRWAQQLAYRLELDFADLGRLIMAQPRFLDPENPGFLEASLTYQGLPGFDIKVGYQRIPYSRSALTPMEQSAYWHRAPLQQGNVFTRRDVGVTLYRSFAAEQVKAYLGVYSGLGEAAFLLADGGNSLEGVARLELSYPGDFGYEELDVARTPQPQIALGGGLRYGTYTRFTSNTFIQIAGPYALRYVPGNRWAAQADLAFRWQGLSALVEYHQLQFADGTTAFRVPGLTAQAQYLLGPWFVSGRFMSADLHPTTDPGQSRTASAALGYRLPEGKSMLKLQWDYALSEENGPLGPSLGYAQQVWFGWQYRWP